VREKRFDEKILFTYDTNRVFSIEHSHPLLYIRVHKQPMPYINIHNLHLGHMNMHLRELWMKNDKSLKERKFEHTMYTSFIETIDSHLRMT
jgi:hypothetical protein